MLLGCYCIVILQSTRHSERILYLREKNYEIILAVRGVFKRPLGHLCRDSDESNITLILPYSPNLFFFFFLFLHCLLPFILYPATSLILIYRKSYPYFPNLPTNRLIAQFHILVNSIRLEREEVANA